MTWFCFSPVSPKESNRTGALPLSAPKGGLLFTGASVSHEVQNSQAGEMSRGSFDVVVLSFGFSR